ncbi:hypothetical protein BG74_08920 [Sodalis-like endosymbiont of Proechinophthirus fluctus]|nr:hypothetical protein BG74_08920 [Sodalis-like endosymbiont of Proechinophthirus fluctus]
MTLSSTPSTLPNPSHTGPRITIGARSLNLDASVRIAAILLGVMRIPRQFGGADGMIPDVVELVIALAKRQSLCRQKDPAAALRFCRTDFANGLARADGPLPHPGGAGNAEPVAARLTDGQTLAVWDVYPSQRYRCRNIAGGLYGRLTPV